MNIEKQKIVCNQIIEEFNYRYKFKNKLDCDVIDNHISIYHLHYYINIYPQTDYLYHVYIWYKNDPYMNKSISYNELISELDKILDLRLQIPLF